MEEEKKNIKAGSSPKSVKLSMQSTEPSKEGWEIHKKPLMYSKPSETFPKLIFNSSGVKKHGKLRDLYCKRPSEIPKLSSISEMGSTKHAKIGMLASKLPIKINSREFESRTSELPADPPKPKFETTKGILKTSKTKKNGREENQVKEALKADFSKLVPYYQKELKKITDIWVNSIYCSLTLRTNLVKLLFQAFPSIDRNQFHAEDEKLLYCIAHAKTCTKLETENLIQFIRSILASQEKIKEDYAILAENKEIAQAFSYDWRDLTRKIAELGEETKQLQVETPELIKKKEELEKSGNEKIQKLQLSLNKKEDEIQKLIYQLDLLKQRENSYKGSIFLKLEDYKDIKADVLSLISIKKEYEELKAKHMYQNDIYEKKIKDLETLLEEKTKILDKEVAVKNQLQSFLKQLEDRQNRLSTTIGKDQLNYVMGKPNRGRDKRREQLWVTAIKLVLKGFLIQIKRLERDRNKMLLELQSNDSDNFRAIANTIIQKENFIKSVKNLTKAYQKTITYQNTDNFEKTYEERHIE